jgi:DNA polymerase-3 subunit delta'
VKSFSQILGQEKAVGFLKKVLRGDRIPHAYLFTGVNGVGKSTTAMALARAINCGTDISDEGCGDCVTCRQLASGNFPDFISLEPDGQNIKIEQIRELNRSLNFKPVSGKYRITIIDRAEMMTEEAANSFLKTLEEPPPGNIIVLKVVDPLDLLPTIISRCQKVPFHPLAREVIRKYLVEQLDQDDNTAWLAAGISEGSLGRAVEICEEGFLEERKGLIQDIMKLPDMSRVQVLDMAIECNKKYSKKAKGDQANIDLYGVTGIWKTYFRDLLLSKVHGNYELLVNRDYSDILNELTERYDADKLIKSFFLVDGYQRDLLRNPNTGLMMEKMLLELKSLNRCN